MSADGLLFSSPGTRICDQWHLESLPASGLFTKPTSNLRSPVEPGIGLFGCATGLRPAVRVDLKSSANAASFSHKSANQLKTSSWFASCGQSIHPSLTSGLLPSRHFLKTASDAVL